AMKLRLSRGAVGTFVVAGVGLALFPVLLPRLDARQAGSLVSVWVFALASLQRSAIVASLVDLSRWGATVLRRSVRAAWIMSAVLVAGHVLFWSSERTIQLSALLPVVPLLLVRSVRSEARVWALTLATLVLVGIAMPASFSTTALLAAAALGLRAFSPD